MAEKDLTNQNVKKFAGIEVPPDLSKTNFFFLFFNTMLIGMFMSIPAILQPAFLKDIIKVSPDFFGSINGLLQNMSQIATLAFVGLVGVMSDKVGRKILAFFAFVVLAIFFYLYGISNEIASLLNVPAGLASKICAMLSFVPTKSSEFLDFAPGLFIAYIIRLIIGIGLVLGYPQFITMVADYTYEKDRGKGMALNGLMMGLAALLIFSVFAPIQKKTGVESLFYISTAIALFAAICTWVFLKDRLPETKKEKKGLREIIAIVNKSLPLKTSYMCSLITRADIVVLATFLVSWAVKVGDTYGLTSEAATQKGVLPLIVMSICSFISFPVAGILIDKWGRIPTIILSVILAGVGLIVIAACPNPFSWVVFVGAAICSFGMAGAMAGANTLASDASPKGLLGTILGGLNTMQPIGILFFLALGGYLFDVFSPGWAFAIKGIANLILGIWIFMIKGRIRIASA